MKIKSIPTYIVGIIVAFICLIFPFSSEGATWQTVGNYNISWYNSSDSEYTISTAKELAGLAYIVNNGYADFQNKTIKLGADIDLSANNWISIGIGSSTYFKGSFNGNNHTISGIYMGNESGVYPYYGFFTYLNGNDISDLKLIGSTTLYFADASYPKTYCGALSGYANNCHFFNIYSCVNISYEREKTSAIGGYPIQIGGIVGKSEESTFEYCINEGNIRVDFGRKGIDSEYYTESSSADIGGICGEAKESTIIGCGNKNNSLESYFAGSCNTQYGYVYIGGIIGSAAYGGTIIKGCYNNANNFVAEYYGSSYNSHIRIGGIAASSSYYVNMDIGHISNNYSSTTSYNSNTTLFYYGGIVGSANNYSSSSSKYAANYSPNDITTNRAGKSGFNGSTSFSRNMMLEDAFLDELNIYPILNETTYKWYRDSAGYPYANEDSKASINLVEIDENKPDFSVRESNIIFNYDVDVSLYNLQGKCIYTGTTSIIPNIPAGIYIIRYCNIAKKILVK